MKYSFFLLLLFAFGCTNESASHSDEPSHRAEGLKEAEGLLKSGNLPAAYKAVHAVAMDHPARDSVYYLDTDLSIILDQAELEAIARSVNGQPDGWKQVAAGSYPLAGLGLNLPQSAMLIREPLLAMKRRLPLLTKQHAAEKEQQRKQEAALAKAAALEAAAQEKAKDAANYEKRGEIEKTLRESFLDNNMDVEVKVSGKNRTRITLTYPLMGAVMEHQMDKAGNISSLLDLGFKEVELTDGYDFDKIWHRKR